MRKRFTSGVLSDGLLSGRDPKSVSEEDRKWHERTQKMDDYIRNGYKPQPSKKLAEECLRSYLRMCDSIIIQARGDALSLGEGDATQRARKAWVLLQQARLFVIGPEQYGRMYHKADRYTTQVLAGLDYDIPNSVEESRKLVDVYRNIGPYQPFPERLPFDAMYLSYGDHLIMSEMQVFALLSQSLVDEMGITSTKLLGHIVGTIQDEPFAAVAIELSGSRVTVPTVALVTAYEDDEWHQPMSLDPWVVPSLIEIINQHKQIVSEHPVSFGMKLDHKAKSKRSPEKLPIPKPYYTLELRDELIDQALRKPAASTVRVFSHRWDVRGHECVRVARGKLPIDGKVEAKLKKKEYRIYSGANHMPMEDFDRLTKRKIALPARDEWLAVLSYWRDPHVAGPEGKPYVPALRTLPKG